MYELIDKLDQRKIDVLKKVFHSNQHSCLYDDLLTDVNITQKTLKKIIEDVECDLKDFGFLDLITLKNYIGYTYKSSTITMDFSENFNMQRLINAYVRKSIKFRLLERLLYSKFKTLREVADYFHVSYVQIRRIIGELNDFFSGSDLFINTRRSVFIEGSETGIRFFYSYLLLMTYGGEEWPFSTVSFYDVGQLLCKCPSEVYCSDTLDKSFLVRYHVSIHLIRSRKNFFIIEKDIGIPLYMPHTISNKRTFYSLAKALKKHLPHLNDIQLEQSASVLCSGIIALGDYSSVKVTPDFFFLNPEIKQSQITHLTFYILDRLDYHLYSPLNSEERDRVLYALMCLHYRVFYTQLTCIRLKDVLYSPLDSSISDFKRHKIHRIKQLVNREMQSTEFDFIRKYESYLVEQYYNIYDRYIDFPKHTAPITVTFISAFSNLDLQKEIRIRYSSYFNLKVSDTLSRTVDLIVTDLPVSHDAISGILYSQPIIHCHKELVESDFNKLTNVLSRIAKKKFTK
ncbi:helix-turn-helix domain-containing protein [Enterococcus faecalis]|uniref:helix-turn-helix domain-containing protein n=1 Tax=Enterococcus faecalis TaxID=1351 RepID=UPI0035E8B79B